MRSLMELFTSLVSLSVSLSLSLHTGRSSTTTAAAITGLTSPATACSPPEALRLAQRCSLEVTADWDVLH